jgi:lysophospholipase L1-like esterase
MKDPIFAVIGDSILKGIQLNPTTGKYFVDSHLNLEQTCQAKHVECVNYSMFGATLEKGKSILQKHLNRGEEYQYVMMDFGGNDCDFIWSVVADDPSREYNCKTPMEVFESGYKELIERIRSTKAIPILCSLPPLDPNRFLDWYCKGLNQANVLQWLGTANTIYRFQEYYSKTVEKIAAQTQTLLFDMRATYLEHHRIDSYLCLDGVHPNTAGQQLLAQAFSEFIDSVL